MAEPPTPSSPPNVRDQGSSRATTMDPSLRQAHRLAKSSRWSWATRSLHAVELLLAVGAGVYGMALSGVATHNFDVQVAEITISNAFNVTIVLAILTIIAVTGRDAILGMVEKIGQDTDQWGANASRKIGLALATIVAMYTIGNEHWEIWIWFAAMFGALVVIMGTQVAIVKMVYDASTPAVTGETESQEVYAEIGGENDE